MDRLCSCETMDSRLEAARELSACGDNRDESAEGRSRWFPWSAERLVPGGDTYPSLSLSSRCTRCSSVETAERGPVPETAAADTAEGQLSSRAGREVGLPALERGRRPDGKWA